MVTQYDIDRARSEGEAEGRALGYKQAGAALAALCPEDPAVVAYSDLLTDGVSPAVAAKHATSRTPASASAPGRPQDDSARAARSAEITALASAINARRR